VTEFRGSPPWSDAGFYDSHRNELIVNAESGAYGTACHEAVHALVAQDWGLDRCPIWFNEGFASIYEWPVVWPDGHYTGGTTHRLSQVSDGDPISLERLLAASTPAATARDFSGRDAARYQATARLICVYLQETHLLQRFYREFRDAKGDPTGRKTLRLVTGKTLTELEASFRLWLDGL